MPENTPVRPKLRPLDSRWVTSQGDTYLLLRDPQGISDKELLVPQAITPLLSLCDGKRDIPSLQIALELLTGLHLSREHIEQLMQQFKEALFLDDVDFDSAREAMLKEYLEVPYRKPALAGTTYPQDPRELRERLDEFCNSSATSRPQGEEDGKPVMGLISPHIDYQRGAHIYASVWLRVAETVRQRDLVIILGTDHTGGPGRLTLTRQNYATPWGTLPTAQDMVNELAGILGKEQAFDEEIHHIKEHSIELALVWLHYLLGDTHCQVLPILCGSFSPQIQDGTIPWENETVGKAIAMLRGLVKEHNAFVVAAGDLAHVGPAFGDRLPMDAVGRANLRGIDEALLSAICAGDREEFFRNIQREGDRYKICGLSPIYLALSILEDIQGEVTGYQHCPADAQGDSLVSIAGVLLKERDSHPS